MVVGRGYGLLSETEVTTVAVITSILVVEGILHGQVGTQNQSENELQLRRVLENFSGYSISFDAIDHVGL